MCYKKKYANGLMMSMTSQKPSPFNSDFSQGNRYKSSGAMTGKYGGVLQSCHIVLC